MSDCRVDVDWKIANRPKPVCGFFAKGGADLRAETDPVPETNILRGPTFKIYRPSLA